MDGGHLLYKYKKSWHVYDNRPMSTETVRNDILPIERIAQIIPKKQKK